MKILIPLALLAAAAAAVAQDANAYLGVGVEPVDARLRKSFRIGADVEGVLITALVTPSAAVRAGLRLGDVLVAFDGQPVRTRDALVEAIRAHKPGDAVSYELRRGTGTVRGSLRLGVEEEGASMLTLRTGDESPAPPEPARPAETARPQPQQARSDLDRRLDDLQAEIARLRERVLAERRRRATGEHRDEAAHARPRSLGEWIRQEEVALREAEGRHDEERIAWRRARLGILREMREAGLRLPVERLERVERRLDEILELLQRRK